MQNISDSFTYCRCRCRCCWLLNTVFHPCPFPVKTHICMIELHRTRRIAIYQQRHYNDYMLCIYAHSSQMLVCIVYSCNDVIDSGHQLKTEIRSVSQFYIAHELCWVNPARRAHYHKSVPLFIFHIHPHLFFGYVQKSFSDIRFLGPQPQPHQHQHNCTNELKIYPNIVALAPGFSGSQVRMQARDGLFPLFLFLVKNRCFIHIRDG